MSPLDFIDLWESRAIGKGLASLTAEQKFGNLPGQKIACICHVTAHNTLPAARITSNQSSAVKLQQRQAGTSFFAVHNRTRGLNTQRLTPVV